MIYFDNASTTRVSEKAAAAALKMMTEVYSNPSSMYGFGLQSELVIRRSAQSIARMCGVNDYRRIIFTSGATEANNLAVLGLCEARRHSGKKIVSSAYEHSSVMGSLRQLEQSGYSVVRIPPRSDGTVSPEEFADAVDSDTVLAVCMLVNNETGGINPIGQIAAACKRKNPSVIFHCDAVQGFCKVPFHAEAFGVDTFSVTGHKIHAPKGVGALYIKKGVRIVPRALGGAQQEGIRPGTENVPGIAAFGVAVDDFTENGKEYSEKILLVNRRLKSELRKLDGVKILSSDSAVSNIISIAVTPIKSETMLHFLEQKKIYLSSGSACNKGAKSHVIEVWPISDKDKSSVLRIGLSHYNTEEEAVCVVGAIQEGIAKLRTKNGG